MSCRWVRARSPASRTRSTASSSRSELGFSRVSRNSIDAVSDRDFVVEFQAAAATTMMHLSRLAEEIVLWSSDEFGFVRLPRRLRDRLQHHAPEAQPRCRRAGARPHRPRLRQPGGDSDDAEGLPLAYNRDLQEDKQPLFDTVDTLLPTLEVLAAMLPDLTVDAEKAESAARRVYTLATDLADYLVRKGVPFREAHQAVAALVRDAVVRRQAA